MYSFALAAVFSSPDLSSAYEYMKCKRGVNIHTKEKKWPIDRGTSLSAVKCILSFFGYMGFFRLDGFTPTRSLVLIFMAIFYFGDLLHVLVVRTNNKRIISNFMEL